MKVNVSLVGFQVIVELVNVTVPRHVVRARAHRPEVAVAGARAEVAVKVSLLPPLVKVIVAFERVCVAGVRPGRTDRTGVQLPVEGDCRGVAVSTDFRLPLAG